MSPTPASCSTRSTDPDERDAWREELADKEAQVDALEGRIKELLLPHDPNEGRNVIVEIQGTEGGEEANLWAGDLYRMYQRFAERNAAEDRGAVEPAVGARRLPRRHVPREGRRRVEPIQVRGRSAPGAARARDREPGAHPHERGDGRGAARGRGDRRRGRSERSRDRRVPRRPVPVASRSTPPTPPCASRTSPPASSCRARTRRASSRTRTRRCGSCAPACCRPSRIASTPR